MKTLYLYLLLMTTSLLSGCSSFSLSGQASFPAENWMFLHQNPKAGDYSIIENEHFQYRYEITKAETHFVEVRFSLKDKSGAMMMGKLEDIERFYELDYQGNVMKSWVRSKSSGETIVSRVAKPRDHFYVDNQRIIPIVPPISTSFSGQPILLNAMHINHTSQGDLGVSTDMKVVSYYNSQVPFGTVEKEWEISGGALTLIQHIESYVAKTSGMEVLHQIIKQLRSLEDDPNKQRMTLVEFHKEN